MRQKSVEGSGVAWGLAGICGFFNEGVLCGSFQNITILIIGTPKKVPLILGNPHVEFRVRVGSSIQRSGFWFWGAEFDEL